MSPRGGGFQDESEDLLGKVGGMSDADIERLMGLSGGEPVSSTPLEDTESGTRLRGIVIDTRGGEVLIELDGKSVGVIDEEEFEGGEVPTPGESIEAEFVRFDRAKQHAVLSINSVRKQVFWEELRRGSVLEGEVIDTNRGGLTLSISGERAFMPISQIDRSRVEDLQPFVGQRMICEVTDFDVSSHNLVVSRRNILEREAEEERGLALSRLSEGEVLGGTVRRLTEHGAFIDIGGVDGLLHASKIRQELKGEPDAVLEVGQRIDVEIVRIDPERERIALDFKQVVPDEWGEAIGDYAIGDEVMGWVKQRTDAGAILSIDEGIHGLLPAVHLPNLKEEPLPGALVKATIASIDPEARTITLKPQAGTLKPQAGTLNDESNDEEPE